MYLRHLPLHIDKLIPCGDKFLKSLRPPLAPPNLGGEEVTTEQYVIAEYFLPLLS